jgi:ubiquitin-protein ligase
MLPPLLQHRVNADCEQLQAAGYPTTLAYQQDGVLFTCDMPPTHGMKYTLNCHCSMVYPAEPPHLRITERGFDDYGQIQHNQLTVILPQLNRWTADVTLLELARTVEQQLADGQYLRVPAGQPPMAAPPHPVATDSVPDVALSIPLLPELPQNRCRCRLCRRGLSGATCIHWSWLWPVWRLCPCWR